MLLHLTLIKEENSEAAKKSEDDLFNICGNETRETIFIVDISVILRYCSVKFH